MPLNPDDTLLNGQYRILRLLGRGGFGFVYQARDTLLHDDVAIKELIPSRVGDEGILKRFLAEARATMRLAHDHIVRTHNVFQQGENYYIVMECMSGRSLEDRLRERGSLPIGEAVRIATEVCDGLSYAHAHGIVHCDLKPANILFDADGAAKVADFGIAHVSGEMLTRSWMTPAGFVAGTLPYMSPEQADGVRDDPRVDVYALGAVLYRMLTGRTYLDFAQSETPGAQADNVLRIRSEEPKAPSTHNRAVPAWLDAVILQALAKRPEERHKTTQALRAALLSGSEGPPPPSEPAQPTVSATGPRRPVWLWAAGGAVAALLVVLAIVLLVAPDGTGDGGGTNTPEPTRRVVTMATVPIPSQFAEASPSAVPSPTWTRTPTWTPTESPTLTPTDTSTPTEVSPAATSTEPPLPTHTRTPTPTATLRPTDTRAPTVSLTPTDTRTPIVHSPPPAPTPLCGGYLTFVSERDGNKEIYVMQAGGEGLRRLTDHPADDRWPSWSPDGRQLAFMSNRNGNWDIYVMNADGSGQRRLTDSPAQDLSPCWSPDGRQIAFYSDRDGQDNIYVMNVDGNEQTRLTNLPGDERDPSWSPDGQRIAFRANHVDGVEIFVMNADGTGQKNLTNRPGDDWDPSWSPDGVHIAFTARIGDQKEVYVMNADGSEQRNLTNHPAEDWWPRWSPDGNCISFTSSRDGGVAEVYVMGADGSQPRNWTNHGSSDHDAAWAPW